MFYALGLAVAVGLVTVIFIKATQPLAATKLAQRCHQILDDSRASEDIATAVLELLQLLERRRNTGYEALKHELRLLYFRAKTRRVSLLCKQR